MALNWQKSHKTMFSIGTYLDPKSTNSKLTKRKTKEADRNNLVRLEEGSS